MRLHIQKSNKEQLQGSFEVQQGLNQHRNQEQKGPWYVFLRVLDSPEGRDTMCCNKDSQLWIYPVHLTGNYSLRHAFKDLIRKINCKLSNKLTLISFTLQHRSSPFDLELLEKGESSWMVFCLFHFCVCFFMMLDILAVC